MPGSKPPTDFTEAEIKREYDIDKQQRSYENRIRQMKTEERQLRAAGYTDEAKKLRKRWRKLTLDYQLYSIDHNRAFYRYRCVIDRAEEEEYAKLNSLNILTQPSGDDIIINENIKSSLGDYTKVLQQTINNAEPILKEVYVRYQSNFNIANTHSRKDGKEDAYFSPKEGAIYIDIDIDGAESNKYRKQFNSYFHETGHHLDFIIGKKYKYAGDKASSGYISKTQKVKKKKNIVSWANGNYITIPKEVEEYATFDEMIVAESKGLIESYKKQLLNNNITVTNKMIYKAICDDLIGERLADLYQLSDIFDGVTNGEMRKLGYSLGVSHTKNDKDYWKTHTVGSEAFAHFTSLYATNKEKLNFYKLLFPKSFKIYEEIIKL